jgi:hypothetical protein
MMTRSFALLLLAAGLALPVPVRPAVAQAPRPAPHAWLFGTWTGGLFPVPGQPAAQACLAQPVVIFSRDVVLRATLADVIFVQREIETARTSGEATAFRFLPAQQAPGAALLGAGSPEPARGFGCASPDELTVRRLGDNEIAFPGCVDFPYPLVRCPSR